MAEVISGTIFMKKTMNMATKKVKWPRDGKSTAAMITIITKKVKWLTVYMKLTGCPMVLTNGQGLSYPVNAI